MSENIWMWFVFLFRPFFVKPKDFFKKWCQSNLQKKAFRTEFQTRIFYLWKIKTDSVSLQSPATFMPIRLQMNPKMRQKFSCWLGNFRTTLNSNIRIEEVNGFALSEKEINITKHKHLCLLWVFYFYFFWEGGILLL